MRTNRPTAAPADAIPAARKAIQAAYDHMDAAIRHRDERGAFAFHAPDHVATFEGQEVGMAQSRQALGDLLDGARYIRSTTTIESFVLNGGREALVTNKSYFKASVYEPATDSRALVTMTSTARDTWIRDARGRWLLKRTRILSLNATRNGRPVPSL